MVKLLVSGEEDLTFRTLLLISAFPFSIWAISSLIEIRASQNLSNSACKMCLYLLGRECEEKRSYWDQARACVKKEGYLAFTLCGFDHECARDRP